MPLKITLPPGGPTGPLAAPVIQNLTATFDAVNRRIVLAFSQPSILANGIVVEFKTATDEAETDANHPFLWHLPTKKPLNPSSVNFFLRDCHELETYTFRVSTVDVLGNKSGYAIVNLTTPQFAPQNHLSLWSEDFSKGGQGAGIWSRSFPTQPVAASGGGQLVTFGGPNVALTQYVPTDLVGGRTYTVRARVRAAVAGDVGKTFNLVLNSDDDGSYNDKLITLTAADQDVTHEITFPAGKVGRTLNIGVSTYAGNATQIVLTRLQLSQSTAAALPAYELTQGPGTTWGQACQMQSGKWWTVLANGSGYGGWHKSLTNGVHCIEMPAGAPGTFTFSGNRTVSKSGDHIRFQYAGNYRLVCSNFRARGLHPKADNLTRGRFISGDYLYKFSVTNCWADHTSGMATQNFLGTGNGDTITVLSNRIMDTDGRRTTAAGGYVLSPFSDIQNRPNGAPIGYDAVANLHINGLIGAASMIDSFEVAYNEFVMRPGFGRVEDAYNMAGFAGTVASPARIHHNVIYRLGWDYAWFADPNRLTRTYSGGAIGNPGDPYYITDGSIYDSGSGGMPVDSSMHEWDFNKMGKNVLVYANTLLGVGSIMGLLDGRNVQVRNNRFIGSGTLPGLTVPVQGGGRVGGVQVTRYRQGQVTLTAASAQGSTSLALTSDLTDTFWAGASYKQFAFSNGVQFFFGYNGTKPNATSANIYNVGGNVPVGSTATIAVGMCYATITVTGTALTSASSSMTFSAVITSGYRAGGFIKFDTGVVAQITADSVFGATNTLTISALSGAVPINTKGDYFDGYFQNNLVAENEFRVPMADAYITGPVAGGVLDAATTRDNLLLGACTPADEFTAYGDWQAQMAAWGRTAGPLVA